MGYNIHTFSDNIGKFILYAPSTDATLADITVSAVGASKLVGESPERGYILSKVNLDYDAVISDVNNVLMNSILPNSNKDFKGWNSLTISDIIVAGITSEIKARTEIHVLPNFSAAAADVHIYCGETFSDCPDFQNYTERSLIVNRPNYNEQAIKNLKHVSPTVNTLTTKTELNYTKNNLVDLDFTIKPNPSTGKFNLIIEPSSDNLDLKTTIDIYDIISNKLYSNNIVSLSTEIDCSQFKKGIYFARLTSGDKIISKKILIQ
jgi:hypothetical protein